MKIRDLIKPVQPRTAALILLLGWAIPFIGMFSFSMIVSGQAVADNQLTVVDGLPPSEKSGSPREQGEADPLTNRQVLQTNESAHETAGFVAPKNSPGANQTTPAPETTAPTGVNNKVRSIDLNLLARVIYAEARGEPLEGQVAVGAVLVNRVASSKFPDDLWNIVFRRGEFCTVRDGQVWMEPDGTAYQAAKLAKNGWDPTNGALYFYNPSKTTSKWIWSRPVTTQIGSHLFAS